MPKAKRIMQCTSCNYEALEKTWCVAKDAKGNDISFVCPQCRIQGKSRFIAREFLVNATFVQKVPGGHLEHKNVHNIKMVIPDTIADLHREIRENLYNDHSPGTYWTMVGYTVNGTINDRTLLLKSRGVRYEDIKTLQNTLKELGAEAKKNA